MKTKLFAGILCLALLVLAFASCSITSTPVSTTASTKKAATDPATDPASVPATDPATDPIQDVVYFTYELDPDDGAFYTLTGVTDAGKELAELTVPTTYNNLPVSAIGADAFSGCTKTTKIVLFKSVVTIFDGAFNGCSATQIVFSDMEGIVYISVLEDGIGAMFTSGVLAGANENVKIYVPAAVYETYLADYFWGDYSSVIEQIQ